MAINIIDKNLSFYSNHSNRGGAPKGIVLHHAACKGSVEDIHRSHKNRGYAGIGYHLYIRKDGTVYRGRPENWLGAHATGYNDRIGVCAEGNFENETMSAAQQSAVVEVLRYLLEKYGDLSIVGHRDLGATACPGKKYPFTAIVQAAKVKDTPTTETNSSEAVPIIKRYQKACIADGVSVGECGADSLYGPDTAASLAHMLSVGCIGERVRFVQSVVGAETDGIFGNETKQKVIEYQARHDLEQDAVVGPDTFEEMLGVT